MVQSDWPDSEEVYRLAEEVKESGNSLYRSKKYKEALNKYSEAIEICPQMISVYGNRSAVYLMLGQPKLALEDAKTAISLDSNFIKGWNRVARCSVLLGDILAAKRAVSHLLGLGEDTSLEGNNIESLEKLQVQTMQAIHEKDYRKAVWSIDKALEIATHCINLKISRAECLAFIGRCEEASEVAVSILQVDNKNVDAMYVRGLCLYYEDDIDKALSFLSTVLKYAPDHSKAMNRFKIAKTLRSTKEEGKEAFNSGNFEEAYKLYSKALEIDSCNRIANAKLYFNRATTSYKLDKPEDVIDNCDKALELDPTYTKALLRRAKTCMEAEKFEDAVRDYEKLVSGDARNREFRNLLKDAKFQLKKSKRKDYYKLLGVDKNANDDEIKKAYRKRAMLHHPDRHSGASETEKKDHEQNFKEVGEAYAVLGDPKKKREYDSGQDITNECMSEGFHDFDPFEMFRSFEGCHGSSSFGAGSDGFRSSGFGRHSFHFTF